jgi:Zn-dependent protease with chaperone function
MIGHQEPLKTYPRLRLLFLLAPSLLILGGCAEVTQPTPTAPQLEAAQLAAAKRHPYLSWSKERAGRVFLRLLPYLPQTQGRTYPFLGFNWWVTATGKVAVDQVWHPSPAGDAGLKQGDVILAVNNWPLHTEAAAWDEAIKTTRNIFGDFLLILPLYRYHRNSASSRVQQLVSMYLPGEILPAIMLDLKHINMEARGRSLTGPVELLIQRDDQKFTKTLYPQLLPAEYAILVDTKDSSINAYASPGKIIVTQRLINLCLNNNGDDELALIIGHEMAHQVLGHLIRGALHLELGKFVGEAFTAFSTLSLTRLLDWRHAMVSPDVRRVAGDAVVSVFSQADEREADIYGAWFAYQAGYNIEKGAAVWERMAAVYYRDPFQRNYFLDDHPAPLERLVRLKLIAQYFKAGRAAEVFLQAATLNRLPPPQNPDPGAGKPASPPLRPVQEANSPKPVGLNHRDGDGYPGFAGGAVHHDLGLIGGQEPMNHEQPQAGANALPAPLGGEEGFEDPG